MLRRSTTRSGRSRPRGLSAWAVLYPSVSDTFARMCFTRTDRSLPARRAWRIPALGADAHAMGCECLYAKDVRGPLTDVGFRISTRLHAALATA